MTDHRALQRTLFRMQLDPSFARAMLAGEQDAVLSTGLSPADLALLDGVELDALSADPGGKRRMQVLGNAASEYVVSVATADRSLVEAFLSSPEFHEAMATGGRLPLAFGRYGVRRAEKLGSPASRGAFTLELAMARARREARNVEHEVPPGAVRLARRALVVELPEGTLAGSILAKASLHRGRSAPPLDVGPGVETVLVSAAVPESSHQLPDVQVELLEPPVDALLLRAREPFGREERAAFARDLGAEPADLERFLDDYVTEGVLVRG